MTPYFPFKGIPKFYDIGGFLKDPEAFALVVEVLVERYKNENITSICGLDARGFVLGPPLALALKKPFFMLRKKGKMPNTVTGEAYAKEYAGNDALSIPRGAVSKGDKVLVIDDLVATEYGELAAIELIKKVRRATIVRVDVRIEEIVEITGPCARRARRLRQEGPRRRAHLGDDERGHPDARRPGGRVDPDGGLRRRRRGAPQSLVFSVLGHNLRCTLACAGAPSTPSPRRSFLGYYSKLEW